MTTHSENRSILNLNDADFHWDGLEGRYPEDFSEELGERRKAAIKRKNRKCRERNWR